MVLFAYIAVNQGKKEGTLWYSVLSTKVRRRGRYQTPCRLIILLLIIRVVLLGAIIHRPDAPQITRPWVGK